MRVRSAPFLVPDAASPACSRGYHLKPGLSHADAYALEVDDFSVAEGRFDLAAEGPAGEGCIAAEGSGALRIDDPFGLRVEDCDVSGPALAQNARIETEDFRRGRRHKFDGPLERDKSRPDKLRDDET